MSKNVLTLSHVSTGYNNHKIIKDVSLSVDEGDFIALIGSNGTGKSTLLKCISGLLPLLGGEITICGQDSMSMKIKDRAKKVAVVPQSYYVDYEFAVEDIIMMGRNPYSKFGRRNTAEDEEIVNKAMALTNTEKFRGKSYNHLSGGERQRVVIARAIAQQPDIILLDEPTSALDLHYATEVMEFITKLNRENNVTVIAVIHDINMAARYCKRIVLLKDGYVRADGTPDEIINQELMTDLYRMNLIIRHNPLFDKPEIMPVRVMENEHSKVSKRIHIICGDSSGVKYIEELYSRNHIISVGVVSRYSDDGEISAYLGIPLVSVEPFCEISPQLHQENLQLMKEADAVIITNIPFGECNISNLYDLDDIHAKIYIHEDVYKESCDFTSDKLVIKQLQRLEEKKDITKYGSFQELLLKI